MKCELTELDRSTRKGRGLDNPTANRTRITGGMIASLLAAAVYSATPTLAQTASGAPAAAASASPTTAASAVNATLERARQAIGLHTLKPDEALRLHGVGDLMGSPVEFDLLLDARGRFVQTFSGALARAVGFDGERVWTHDLAGEQLEATLGDREEALMTAWLIAGWWSHPGTTLEVRAGEKSETLVVSMPGGLTSTEVLIDADGMPRQWAGGVESNRVRTTTSGTVRSGTGANALVYPSEFKSTNETIGGGGGLEVSSVERVKLADTDKAFAMRIKPPEDVVFDPAAASELEIKKAKTGHTLVKALVNGQDLGWFIFDTGAGANCLGTHVLDRVAHTRVSEVRMTGVGATVQSSFVRPESLRVGPVTINTPLMATLDTAFLTNVMGAEIAGIVGYGTMHRCVVEIDKADPRTGGPRVALYNPKTFQRDGLTWQPIKVYERVPCVRAEFEGHEGWFRLDTGSNKFLSFHSPAVKEFDLLANRETTDTQLGGVGGMVKAKAGTIASFTFAGVTTRDAKVDFALGDRGTFADPYVLGNIGSKALEPFVMIFDYQNSRAAFVKRE